MCVGFETTYSFNMNRIGIFKVSFSRIKFDRVLIHLFIQVCSFKLKKIWCNGFRFQYDSFTQSVSKKPTRGTKFSIHGWISASQDLIFRNFGNGSKHLASSANLFNAMEVQNETVSTPPTKAWSLITLSINDRSRNRTRGLSYDSIVRKS